MITRRNVLTGTAAVAAASVVGLPAVAGSEAIPTLWGDGEHDDTEALRWLFARREMHIPDDAPYSVHVELDAFGDDPDRLILKGGAFLLTAPVGVNYAESDWLVTVDSTHIICRGDYRAVGYSLCKTEGDVITNSRIDWTDDDRHAFMRSEWARLRRG